MQNILSMCHRHLIWENIMFSTIKDTILILQLICRPYQANIKMNNTRIWMTRHRLLWEGTHGIFLQGCQFLITMFFQEEGLSSERGKLFDYEEIQGTKLCERECPEETIYWNLELVLASGPVVHGEVDVDFAVYYRFTESKYWLHKSFYQSDITSGEPVFI